MSTPASICRATTLRTASAASCASNASSTASPASWRISRSSSTAGRGRLPTWVTRIRSLLSFMGRSSLRHFRAASGRAQRQLTGTRAAGHGAAMTIDLRTFPRDDVVMDGAGPADWLKPGALIDSDHPTVATWARDIVGDVREPRAKALRLYHAVRDDVRYDPYTTPLRPDAYRASATLAAGHGYCINKAGLMAAACRAVGVP